MRRKQFIEKLGAHCSNHRFSWSFVSHEKKTIYFGSWHHHQLPSGDERIFSLDWEYGENGRAKGFSQSCSHIDLIQHERYKLNTFTMFGADPTENRPVGIKKIDRELREMILVVRGADFWACRAGSPAITSNSTEYIYMEGAKKVVVQTLRERNPEARRKCLERYGFSCRVCEFDFFLTYGKVGSSYIHVHHLEMIGKKHGIHKANPLTDLRPVCPNCHAMIHKQAIPYTINEMRKKMGKQELLEP